MPGQGFGLNLDLTLNISTSHFICVTPSHWPGSVLVLLKGWLVLTQPISSVRSQQSATLLHRRPSSMQRPSLHRNWSAPHTEGQSASSSSQSWIPSHRALASADQKDDAIMTNSHLKGTQTPSAHRNSVFLHSTSQLASSLPSSQSRLPSQTARQEMQTSEVEQRNSVREHSRLVQGPW